MKSLSETTGTQRDTAGWLAILVTLGFFAVIAGLLFVGVPQASRQILNIVLGVLGTGFTMILSYYFGSSKGGDDMAKTVTNGNAQG